MSSSPTDTVWIPAVPLPFLGWRTDTCMSCGQKFKGRNRRGAYQLHYRRCHEERERAREDQTQIGVTRAEAERIYAAVRGDS